MNSIPIVTQLDIFEPRQETERCRRGGLELRLRNLRGVHSRIIRGWRAGLTYHVYHLGDFDRAGQDAANSLREKLERFADEEGIDLVFEQIAVTREQIADWNLPTREPKRKSAADKKWSHDFACELDAIPPDLLRDLVEAHINLHLPQDKLEVLKAAEESERDLIARLVRKIARKRLRSRRW